MHLDVRSTGTDGEVANALVCKTSIRGFDSRSVLHKINNKAAQAKGGFVVCGDCSLSRFWSNPFAGQSVRFGSFQT